MKDVDYKILSSNDLTKELVNSMAELYWQDFVSEDLRRENPEFYSIERFNKRVLDGYATTPNFICITAEANAKLIGFVTATNLRKGSRWWEGATPKLNDDFIEEDGERTLAVFDLLVSSDYRGNKIASGIHNLLLKQVNVSRVTLLSSKPQQPAHAMWLHWGYKIVANQQFDNGPILDLFVLNLQ